MLKFFSSILCALVFMQPSFARNHKVVTAFLATDGGQFTDQIISSFHNELSATNHAFEFTTVSCEGNIFNKADALINRIIALEPDIIFLPDDMMHQKLSEKIRQRSSALLLFTAFYLQPKDIISLEKQAGVICPLRIKELLQNAQKKHKINSVHIVGGPYAEKFAGQISEQLKEAGAIVTISLHHNFADYSQAALTSEADAVWPLAPFGVFVRAGVTVRSEDMNSLLQQVNASKVTLGYGRKDFARRFVMHLEPTVLGKRSAELLMRHLNGEKVGVENVDALTFLSLD